MNIRYRGIGMALTAAILWGISGTFAQYLFQHKQVNAEWLATVRLLTAGALLLLLARLQAQPVMGIWKQKRDAVALLLFSLFGMLAVQYTYFAAIQHSNAATATVLQYVGPALIACYLAVRDRKVPAAIEIVAIVLALVGTFFIVTHGSIYRLSLSPVAFFWGIASAFALAFYTLQPLTLLETWKPAIVVGWGMLLGGIAFCGVHPPWNVTGQWDGITLAMMGFIIVFGSLVPFLLFLTSVKIVGPTNAALLACAEPLSAAVLAVVWLKVAFGIYDWLGTLLIVATIFLLSRKESEKPGVVVNAARQEAEQVVPNKAA